MSMDGEHWRTYRTTRNPALRERLVEEHLSLVKYIAMRVAGRLPGHLGVDDLYSAGLLGFLGAIDDYDPDRGVDFGAYATPRIRGAIFDELRRLDVVPRRVRRRIRDAERAIDTLGRRLSRAPTDEEVAAELGIEVEAYRRILTEGVTLLALDAPPARQEEGASPMDVLEDASSPNPFATAADRERGAILGRMIDRLPPKERQVLALYYYEELTMQEVGKVLGVTESRVSQLHSSAILRLRVELRRQRMDAADLGVTAAAAGKGRR
jgi:RNA polymerase sigma factor for flagellar operon FliA